ncbi:MAG: DUF362 domain-containing protein [Thermodesulfobacteriota bacterium]
MNYEYKVAIFAGSDYKYGVHPFSPATAFPEYPFKNERLSGKGSPAYEGVRQCLRFLNLDPDNYGTASWNPLGKLVSPGKTVVINPNLVLSRHAIGKNLYSIITHPSIIRAICDYVFIALKGSGRIIIADAPQLDCDFEELLEVTQLRTIQTLYMEVMRFEIEILDLRNFWADIDKDKQEIGVRDRQKLPGDPLGGVKVNLGKKSEFYGLNRSGRYFGADYDRKETNLHHCGDVHEYMVSRAILSADVYIAVPKLKVHKKVGVTLNTKGLVGTVVNKNFLVHYTLGTPAEGGDQLPDSISYRSRLFTRISSFLTDNLMTHRNSVLEKLYLFLKSFQRTCLSPFGLGLKEEHQQHYGGNWYGNDSAWRMAVDLAKIIYYADQNGIIHDTKQRKIFSIIDGIIGGENEGPLRPDPKKCGVILAGHNLMAVDAVAARIMGFDPYKIKTIANTLDNTCGFNFCLSGKDIQVISNKPEYQSCLQDNQDMFLNFKCPVGCAGHISIKGLETESIYR